jgi:hypothetical protein
MSHHLVQPGAHARHDRDAVNVWRFPDHQADFPPLQLAASYNLEQVLDEVREMSKDHPSQ